MAFTLQKVIPAQSCVLSCTDGNVRLFEFFRSRMHPGTAKGRQDHSFIFWHGICPPLDKISQYYRGLVAGLYPLAPEYVTKYLDAVKVEVMFGPLELPNVVGAFGSLSFEASSMDDSAEREVRAHLRRRRLDWRSVQISSGCPDRVDLPLISFRVTRFRGIGIQMNIEMGVPAFGFPTVAIADCIEATKPQAYCFENIGPDRYGADIYQIPYKPWLASREELTAILEEVGREWNESVYDV